MTTEQYLALTPDELAHWMDRGQNGTPAEVAEYENFSFEVEAELISLLHEVHEKHGLDNLIRAVAEPLGQDTGTLLLREVRAFLEYGLEENDADDED